MNSGGAAYKPLQPPTNEAEAFEQEDAEEGEELFHDELTTPQAEGIAQSACSRIEPLEMGSTSSGEEDDGDLVFRTHYFWRNVTLSTTIFLVVPSLTTGIVVAIKLSGRIWTCSLFALHLTLSLMKAYCHLRDMKSGADIVTEASEIETTNITAPYRDDHNNNNGEETPSDPMETSDHAEDASWQPSEMTTETETPGNFRTESWNYFLLTSIPSALDILFFGMLYPLIISGFHQVVFIDTDGENIVDWIRYYKACNFVLHAGYITAASRIIVGTHEFLERFPRSTYYLTAIYYVCMNIPILGSFLRCFYRSWLSFQNRFSAGPKAHGCWDRLLRVTLGTSLLFLVLCIYSLIVHFGPFEPWLPHDNPEVCDPLDTTECCLPFPSYFHARPDDSTETGWRVHLNPETFPRLKGRIKIPVDFLNSLDGFSTMGPMLFYIEGMKESHDQYIQELKKDDSLRTQVGFTRLRGHEHLDLSTTPYSTTLLIDVTEKKLVPHSAEIDYLDPKRPVVLLFPAQPLKHNAQYAIAVINATDINGERLPPTPGLLGLLDDENTSKRKELFQSMLLPALEEATRRRYAVDNSFDWGGPDGSFVRSKDPLALQLIFDFHTISKKSQLGNARAVRDHSLQYIEVHWRGNWKDHVRVVKMEDGDCLDEGYPLARTIHGEIDVPWYLKGFGPGYRDATLDTGAVTSGVPTTIGKAKFIVKIPCSLRSAIAPIPNSQSTSEDLAVVVEFGHGLFFNRAEVGDDFLIKMAERNGYIFVACDWRGMSNYDFPIVAKTMLSDPSLFASVRDNLIQGYANKFALQHFVQDGMLDMDWLKFKDINGNLQSIPRSFQADDGTRTDRVRTAFYGISQGGILGAGYMGLAGATGLIPQGVLGVPGSPFSLILSRSLEFVGYDVALLLNFYTNRHVRIFLSLAQMCWDSVEGAGVFGQPVEEPIPRILMQAGLGDPIVPTLAAERLARAINAKVFPDNPRQIWFPENHEMNESGSAFTEMLYKREYNNLPKDDHLTPAPTNHVHICVRLETVLQWQIEEFLNHNNLTDPCALKGGTACIKDRGDCFSRRHNDATNVTLT